MACSGLTAAAAEVLNPAPALIASMCEQKERETRAIAQRLEAATTHGGLLDDTMAALKRQVGEMSTALAERDVAIRQLEDRLRTLQASGRG